MFLHSKRGDAWRGGAWLVAALSALVACSSSGGNPPGAGGGTSDGGTTNGGPASSSAGRAGNAGSAASGGGASGASGSGVAEPSSCLGLQRDPTVTAYYTPPDAMTNESIVGTFDNGQGLLIALDVARGVRLIAVDASGAATELLNETEYQKTWYFDPTQIIAFRRSDGVDVLVTDNADAALIHKEGTTVTVTALDDTSYMDLHVLGFAPTASGMLAMYWKGDASTGTDETLTVLDTTTMKKTTRTFRGASGLLSVPSATGAWLTAERLDFASDCQPTGQTFDCGGGAVAVPSSTCAWHLDVWNIKDKSFTTADPLLSLDVPATIAARCDDTTPAGLATYSSLFAASRGAAGHHLATLDQHTQGLGIAMQSPVAPGTDGIQFELVGPSGSRIIDGTKSPLRATSARYWLAARAESLFICGDDDCAMSNATSAMAIEFPRLDTNTVSADGVALRPDGLVLVGAINGNPLWQEIVSCTH